MSTSGIDFTKPKVARVHDVLLGGHDNFAADRQLAARLTEICPSLPVAAQANRAFITRAVTWASDRVVTQFADLGAGMPLPRKAGSAEALQEIHEAAREVNPSARCAYVDSDPIACSHSRAMRAHVWRGDHPEPADGVAVAEADLREPEKVLANPELLTVIDQAEPVCLVFGLVLSLMPARQAREVVAGYADLLAPGSCMVISCGRCDDEALWRQLREAYTVADIYNHAPGEVEGFLAGLDLVPPGVVAAQNWRGGWHDAPAAPPGPAYVLAAVAKTK
jgi:S-adenosyl methyltransferase